PSRSPHHRNPHSFPTRRSSDLNCHKWLCAPKGAGFLYVRRELQATIAPLVIGWGFKDEATFLARHEKQGTRDPAAFLTVPAAIEDRKSTRLNSSHVAISYAVFC